MRNGTGGRMGGCVGGSGEILTRGGDSPCQGEGDAPLPGHQDFSQDLGSQDIGT